MARMATNGADLRWWGRCLSLAGASICMTLLNLLFVPVVLHAQTVTGAKEAVKTDKKEWQKKVSLPKGKNFSDFTDDQLKTFIEDELKKAGLTDEAARAEADKALRRIRADRLDAITIGCVTFATDPAHGGVTLILKVVIILPDPPVETGPHEEGHKNLEESLEMFCEQKIKDAIDGKVFADAAAFKAAVEAVFNACRSTTEAAGNAYDTITDNGLNTKEDVAIAKLIENTTKKLYDKNLAAAEGDNAKAAADTNTKLASLNTKDDLDALVKELK